MQRCDTFRRSQAEDCGIYILALTVAKKNNAIYFYPKKKTETDFCFQAFSSRWRSFKPITRLAKNRGSDSLNIHRPHKDSSTTRQ